MSPVIPRESAQDQATAGPQRTHGLLPSVVERAPLLNFWAKAATAGLTMALRGTLRLGPEKDNCLDGVGTGARCGWKREGQSQEGASEG